MIAKNDVIYYNSAETGTLTLNGKTHIFNLNTADSKYKFVSPIKFNLFLDIAHHGYIKIHLKLKTKILIKCTKHSSLFEKIVLSNTKRKHKIIFKADRSISCVNNNKFNFHRLIKEELFLSIPLLNKYLHK